MATCSNGHTSSAADYCDICGDLIASTGAASPPSSAAGASAPTPTTALATPPGTALVACPSCNAENAGGALFCEDCGYDFTTGQMPAAPSGPPNSLMLDPPSAPASAAVASAASGTGWVAEVWVDPDWFNLHGINLGDPCPSATTPKVVVLRDPVATIGRSSRSRGITPTIDCGTDSAVSHKHATLTLDGDRWFIEDTDSTNGTYISVAGSPLPDNAITPASSRELGANERIQLGAWTRIVIRSALPGE